MGHFCPPGSGLRVRIRIQWLDWIRIQLGSETLQKSTVRVWSQADWNKAFLLQKQKYCVLRYWCQQKVYRKYSGGESYCAAWLLVKAKSNHARSVMTLFHRGSDLLNFSQSKEKNLKSFLWDGNVSVKVDLFSTLLSPVKRTSVPS